MERFWCNGKEGFCDKEKCDNCNWFNDSGGELKESSNPYWERISDIANKQRKKGIETYGQGLEANMQPDPMTRIEYIEEELIDALMYLEWLKEGMKKNESN